MPEFGPTAADGTAIPNTQTFTFITGELYVTVLRSRFTPLIRKWQFTVSNALIELAVRGRGAVHWPPPVVLGDRGAEEISRAVLEWGRQLKS